MQTGSARMDNRSGQRGFTVFELIVAMTIAALLVTVAIPSFVTVVRNSNQIGAANEFLSSLHLARDLAITRNVRVTVCTSSSGEACQDVGWDEGWIVFVDTDGNGQVSGDEVIDRAVSEVPVPSITSGQFANRIVYRPNGRVMAGAIANNTGELTFCDDRGAEFARVAIIDMSGRPRIAHHMMDGSDPACPSDI